MDRRHRRVLLHAVYDYICWNSDYNEALSIGMRSFLLQAALTSGILLMFLRRWEPAPGAWPCCSDSMPLGMGLR